MVLPPLVSVIEPGRKHGVRTVRWALEPKLSSSKDPAEIERAPRKTPGTGKNADRSSEVCVTGHRPEIKGPQVADAVHHRVRSPGPHGDPQPRAEGERGRRLRSNSARHFARSQGPLQRRQTQSTLNTHLG